jgi:hypothetical protein
MLVHSSDLTKASMLDNVATIQNVSLSVVNVNRPVQIGAV